MSYYIAPRYTVKRHIARRYNSRRYSVGMRGLSLLLPFLPLVATAQSNVLVTTDWLATRLQDSKLVLLHVSTPNDYAAGHIPGARLVTLADLSVTGERGLRLELPPADSLRNALLKLGVSDDSITVIYPGNESIQSATRIWFTFDYLGLRASLLDGGLAAWKGERSTEPAKWVPSTQLTIKPRPELVVDAAWVSEHLKDAKVRILDARTPEFYSGTSAGQMPRAGHIPGAHNVPFSSVLTADRRVLPLNDLRAKLGVPEGAAPVVYCHIGQQASVLYFVSRVAGLNPKLYDGSFQDWSARAELPVESK